MTRHSRLHNHNHKGFLLLCLTIILLNGLLQVNGTPSQALDRMEEAFDLLEKWKVWYQQDKTSGSSSKASNIASHGVGFKCDEIPADTLRRAYYLRIFHSFDPTLEADESTKNWATHIAKNSKFYKEKMGFVPKKKDKDFCGFEPNTNFHANGFEFKWPTIPALTVCDDTAKKCVRCKDVDTAQRRTLAEACKLMLPTPDVQPALSEPQILYEKMKQTLQDITPKLAKQYGSPCKATEEQSGAFMKLWVTVGVKGGKDPLTKQEFVDEWKGIREVQGNYEKYSDLVKSFTSTDFDDEVYCDPTYSEGFRKMGSDSLVCGGMTCKGCRDNPPPRDDKLGRVDRQTWKYETGPLYEACKSINAGLAELDKPKVCPAPPPCIKSGISGPKASKTPTPCPGDENQDTQNKGQRSMFTGKEFLLLTAGNLALLYY